ncbi:dienelactone hydrolase family protein [Aquabacterium sp.]|uniref:alpha/beta hydrolase family protein n=1 Tax=Aquabacterium sp. TaxID=1872578 RepID=UPI0024884830|nr:dienelactone hydrolase family protein [Aquabacterium sp.]MDI1261385.1 dienelactone hydrolase family protein [Aquabacterium sp.]
MLTPASIKSRALFKTRLLGAAVLSLVVGLAQAQVHGPDPTVQSLEAAAGPYKVSSAVVSAPSGYGAGTVFYPTVRTEGQFGLVVLAPGFLAVQGYYKWLAERVASHGFVVVTVNFNSTFDQPDSRGTQMAKALQQVVALSKTATSPYSGVTDTNRQAAMGHSMGGGGTLVVARDNPSLKAAVALAPWHTTKTWSTVQVPTLIISDEKDFIATNSAHSNPFYASFNAALPSAKIELAGADHLCGIQISAEKCKTSLAKYSVAWLKRFVDGDTRYTPFVKSKAADMSAFDTRGQY